jgi:hypothetical protein
VGSFEGFTQSNKTLRTCFSFCRSYCNSSWKLSRGISQIKLSEIFESYLKFFEIIGRKCLPFIIDIDVQAHVFKSKSGACATFLANYNPRRSGISITTYLLGLLAFFLTVNTLFITLQG